MAGWSTSGQRWIATWYDKKPIKKYFEHALPLKYYCGLGGWVYLHKK